MLFLEGEIPEYSYDKAEAVILPLPFEKTTSFGKGTVNGPCAILAASPHLELYDEELDEEPFKAGIFTCPAPVFKGEIENDFAKITEVASTLLKDEKFIVSIGGEHSVSFPLFRAFHRNIADLSVVQLDAHADLRDTYQNSKYSHACVMRRILELTPEILQLGVRSLCAEEARLIKDRKLKTVFAQQTVYCLPVELIPALKDNVYLTIDVDFFDPSLIPATGTPEPGGFFWNETLRFLRELFSAKNVVGVDVVEFSPIKGFHSPQFTVARLIYKLIGYKFFLNK